MKKIAINNLIIKGGYIYEKNIIYYDLKYTNDLVFKYRERKNNYS